MTKTIVVVGASRGIGKEIVLRYAANSENTVIALSRNTEAMKAFDEFANVKAISFDLNSNNVREAAEAIFDDLKTIDILVNNAGYLVNKPFDEITYEDFMNSYQVNTVGPMQVVQAAVPLLSFNGGHIVNISSVGGFQGSIKFPGLTAYSTSKAAIASFTEMFAEEYKDTKIKINCLCLGAVQTEMLEAAFPGFQAPVTPANMAEYICDFASNAHKWMNGKIIPVSLSNP